MKGVIVGYGSIGPLHCVKLRQLHVQVGVVDIAARRRAQAIDDGADAFLSIEAAAAQRPDFWAVCVGTPDHLSVVERIVAAAPDACILVEKPICLHAQLDELERVLRRFRGKICVNENYYGSRVTPLVRHIALEQLKLHVHRVVVEMTKNREQDFGRGRFVDPEGGAIKYEGTHMLAVLQDLGGQFLFEEILEARSKDALLWTPDGPRLLEHQGAADFRCRTPSGVEVLLHTSMIGEAQHRYPPFLVDRIPPDSAARHRVAAIHGRDEQGREVVVVGFYEPIEGLPRGYGAVCVLRDGRVEQLIAPLQDDHMTTQLGRCLDYFRGLCPNPNPLPAAIHATRVLHSLGQAATAAAPHAQAGTARPMASRMTSP